jgi:eukaryotic-like serine/threonine-protein kinase
MNPNSIVQTLVGPHGHGVPIGRYLLHRQIARGGMATIHIARLMGDEGFSRIVAAKRLLPEFATDAEFVSMFLDEARIASKVHHRNVVPVLDVVATEEEVILVQEFVHGVPLHLLLRTARAAKDHVPVQVAVSIACQVLAGLQAAHETVDELGTPLAIVHRDVSPQNVMVAVDGTARLLDFGVAKATMAAHVTRDGTFKGKLAYSAPEQLRGHANPQSDVYALSVVLWELLVGHRMHHSAVAESELVAQVMSGQLPKLTDALAAEREQIGPDRWEQLEQLESIIATGLAVSLQDRWASAADMEQALTHVVTPATPTEVAAWLKTLGKDMLEKNEKLLAAEEQSWRRNATPVSVSRRTPVPGTLRSFNDHRAPGSSMSSLHMAPRSRSGLVVALFGIAAIAGVAAGALYIWRGAPATSAAAPVPTVETLQPAHAEPAAAPTPPLPPATVPAAASASQPAAATTPTTSSAAPADTAAPPVQGPVEKTPSIDVEVQTTTTRTASQPPARTTSRPPQRAPARAQTPPPARKAAVTKPGSDTAETSPPPPPPTTPASSKDDKPDKKSDCTPPYYYEGSKKIFKPQCL